MKNIDLVRKNRYIIQSFFDKKPMQTGPNYLEQNIKILDTEN